MKSKISLSQAFKDKKFKYGGMATLLVVVVVVAILVINLLCSFITYRLDVTSNKFYSIGPLTTSIINRLEDDITIYMFYEAGREDDYIMEMVRRYDAASDKISSRLVDPVANPNFDEEFVLDEDKSTARVQANNVVVKDEQTGKFAILANTNLYNYEYDDSGNLSNMTYNAEQAITNAIVAVTGERTYKMGVLTGHGEASLPTAMTSIIDNMFITIETLDLKTIISEAINEIQQDIEDSNNIANDDAENVDYNNENSDDTEAIGEVQQDIEDTDNTDTASDVTENVDDNNENSDNTEAINKAIDDIMLNYDMLVALTPTRDLINEEKVVLMNYLDRNNGNLFLVTGKATADTPNWDEILTYYGVEATDYTIYEEDASNYYLAKYTLTLDCDLSAPDLFVSSLYGSDARLRFNRAKAIVTEDILRQGLTVTNIATTSNIAWATEQEKSDPFTLEPGDKTSDKGFSPVVAIEDYEYNSDTGSELTTKLVVVNCPDFMLTTEEEINAFLNDELFYAATQWFLGSSEMVTILPRVYLTSTHTLATKGLYIYGAVIGIGIPGVILAGGLANYLRRRHS